MKMHRPVKLFMHFVLMFNPLLSVFCVQNGETDAVIAPNDNDVPFQASMKRARDKLLKLIEKGSVYFILASSFSFN